MWVCCCLSYHLLNSDHWPVAGGQHWHHNSGSIDAAVGRCRWHHQMVECTLYRKVREREREMCGGLVLYWDDGKRGNTTVVCQRPPPNWQQAFTWLVILVTASGAQLLSLSFSLSLLVCIHSHSCPFGSYSNDPKWTFDSSRLASTVWYDLCRVVCTRNTYKCNRFSWEHRSQ